MRLYSRTEAASVDHAGVHYEPVADGGFDFPAGVSETLHSFHSRGLPLWETGIERQGRLIQEEAARRADPATLLAAVEQLVEAAKAEAPAAAVKTAAPTAAKAAVKS